MKGRHYWFIIVFFTAFTPAFYLFAEFAEDARAYSLRGAAMASKADAVVVLTGGKGRIEAGLVLLRSGAARTLVLSGVDRDAAIDTIFLNGITAEEKKNIILEKASTTTYENALYVRRIAEERGFKSMILLTSWYHMKRARYAFSRVLRDEFVIYEEIVPQSDAKARIFSAGAVVLPEFFKYYWYALRFKMKEWPS
ncbi:MAG: YdcF family protein [Deltaproteobacteria bacterium]|nr:YdcF family protein [Deltaproteobacteria bacterium]